jgi:hypothetical protein
MHSNFIALDCSIEYAENFCRGIMAGGNGNPFNSTQTEGEANDYVKSSSPRGYKPIIGAFHNFKQLTYMETLNGKMGEYMQFLVDKYGAPKDFNDLVRIGWDEQKRIQLSDWGPGQLYANRGISETPCRVELRQEAIDRYEAERAGRSQWTYVQARNPHRF